MSEPLDEAGQVVTGFDGNAGVLITGINPRHLKAFNKHGAEVRVTDRGLALFPRAARRRYESQPAFWFVWNIVTPVAVSLLTSWVMIRYVL